MCRHKALFQECRRVAEPRQAVACTLGPQVLSSSFILFRSSVLRPRKVLLYRHIVLMLCSFLFAWFFVFTVHSTLYAINQLVSTPTDQQQGPAGWAAARAIGAKRCWTGGGTGQRCRRDRGRQLGQSVTAARAVRFFTTEHAALRKEARPPLGLPSCQQRAPRPLLCGHQRSAASTAVCYLIKSRSARWPPPCRQNYIHDMDGMAARSLTPLAAPPPQSRRPRICCSPCAAACWPAHCAWQVLQPLLQRPCCCCSLADSPLSAPPPPVQQCCAPRPPPPAAQRSHPPQPAPLLQQPRAQLPACAAAQRGRCLPPLQRLRCHRCPVPPRSWARGGCARPAICAWPRAAPRCW